MIYLVDDNKYSQLSENYKLDFTKVLSTYSGYINWIQTISINDIDSILLNATCVLVHDSLDDKEAKERLVAVTRSKGIPMCLFSNGFTATIFDGNSIREIKKDRLYSNLLDFINYFKSKRIIDLKILSLGRNYEIEKASIIQDRLINGTLLINKDKFNYEVTFPSGSREYKDLRELVYLSDPSADFSEFEDFYNSKETTAQSMRMLIVSMAKIVKQKYDQ